MLKALNPRLCAACKGYRSLCGRDRCPILARFKVQSVTLTKLSGTSFSGATPPEVLVGSRTWPVVTVGPLVAPTDPKAAEEMGDPAKLYGKTLDEVVELRAQLVRCNVRIGVKAARRPPRVLEEMREAALSTSGLGVEVKLEKVPKPRLVFDGFLAPTGPVARLADMKVTDNPKVPKEADSLVGDVDAKAEVAMRELYDAGLPTYYISRLLSLGMLGRRWERVLVPSRWSITAVDAAVSKHLAEKAREGGEISEVELFTTEYAGNKYAVIFAPWALSYEMVEIVEPGCVYMPAGEGPWVGSDSEGPSGRSSYPKIGGGYYAAKLPVYEYLARRRRQAFALVVREVTPAYWAPVGSWKIREALRDALRKKPRKFASVDEALEGAMSFVGAPASLWLPKARRLRSVLHQLKITEARWRV